MKHLCTWNTCRNEFKIPLCYNMSSLYLYTCTGTEWSSEPASDGHGDGDVTTPAAHL